MTIRVRDTTAEVVADRTDLVESPALPTSTRSVFKIMAKPNSAYIITVG